MMVQSAIPAAAGVSPAAASCVFVAGASSPSCSAAVVASEEAVPDGNSDASVLAALAGVASTGEAGSAFRT